MSRDKRTQACGCQQITPRLLIDSSYTAEARMTALLFPHLTGVRWPKFKWVCQSHGVDVAGSLLQQLNMCVMLLATAAYVHCR
jgi:hypothetical protein